MDGRGETRTAGRSPRSAASRCRSGERGPPGSSPGAIPRRRGPPSTRRPAVARSRPNGIIREKLGAGEYGSGLFLSDETNASGLRMIPAGRLARSPAAWQSAAPGGPDLLVERNATGSPPGLRLRRRRAGSVTGSARRADQALELLPNEGGV